MNSLILKLPGEGSKHLVLPFVKEYIPFYYLKMEYPFKMAMQKYLDKSRMVRFEGYSYDRKLLFQISQTPIWK